MRILYGIQGTGNGHLSRSREVLAHLEAAGHEVQVLVSGRDPAGPLALETRRPVLRRHGLTFQTRSGRIQPLATARMLQPGRAWREGRELDDQLGTPDLVICDFEPLTAWWARHAGVRSVGVGHQYAFAHPVPCPPGRLASRWVLRAFAPVDVKVGLHWDAFGAPILPPIIPALPPADPAVRQSNRLLVYLPFEARSAIRAWLSPLGDLDIHIYGHPETLQAETDGPLTWHPFQRGGFLEELGRSMAIFCSAGFELPSEAIHAGCRVLVKPLGGQLEQEANALALEQLGLGRALRRPTPEAIQRALDGPAPRRQWPDVAAAVAEWIGDGARESVDELSRRLWRQVV